MESYIEDKKNLYRSIHEFLEGSDEYNDEVTAKESLEKIKQDIRKHPIEGEAGEMRQFLKIINSIGEHHHRDKQFNERMNQLLFHYKEQIKQTLSNSQIFHIFGNNKKIVIFLIKEGIMTISEEISKMMMNKIEHNGNRYCHFFHPELDQFFGAEKMKNLKNDLLKEDPTIFTNYEEKREEGENDSHICFLIRKDSIEEFVEYVNRQNISPSSEILPSIFETNPFLIDNKNTTLIEYSAFFGSIQIFQYLVTNGAELTPSLWLYGIHSQNAELIHLLESNKIPPPNPENKEGGFENPNQNYEQCLIESIKCHHNDIASYIENNFIDQNDKYLQQNEEIISNYIKYHNYTHFQIKGIIDHGFFYLSLYHYDELFELLLKKKEESIEKKMIQYRDIRSASENNEIEVVYHYLLQMNEIPEKLFKYTKIKQITIPSSVTSIGEGAFYGCSSLTQIAISSSVTSIGGSAFEGCSSLTQITIPSSVTSIGDYAFVRCSSLTQITIPSFVTSIGKYAFEGCSSLTQITIPSFVTSIGNYAFEGCSSLAQITIPSSVKIIGDGALANCPKMNKVEIVSCEEKRIECFENKFLAFKTNQRSEIYDKMIWLNPTINSIIIPRFINIIGNSALCGCSSLTQITIPSSVTSIEDSALSRCSSLTQITIPSSVTSIGNSAFEGCSSLTQITFEIPSSVTSIGNYAFWRCSSLTQITIPSSVTSIGNSAFFDCSSLTQITIPSSVTSIGNSAFEGCSLLRQIAIPSSVTSIGGSAFSGCSTLTQITIPSSVTSILEEAFKGCSSLTQITIPSSVTSIEDSAFSDCSSLTQITIPSSVTSIEDSAFSGCSSLTQITIPFSVTSILEEAFKGCSSLTQITIPSSVTSIGNSAFSDCSSLTQITIPSSVTSIGNYAFRKCSRLTQITIPSSVTSIGEGAFSGCSSLAQITIPSSVTSIGEGAFSRCLSLTQITIPSSLKIDEIELNSNVRIIYI